MSRRATLPSIPSVLAIPPPTYRLLTCTTCHTAITQDLPSHLSSPEESLCSASGEVYASLQEWREAGRPALRCWRCETKVRGEELRRMVMEMKEETDRREAERALRMRREERAGSRTTWCIPEPSERSEDDGGPDWEYVDEEEDNDDDDVEVGRGIAMSTGDNPDDVSYISSGPAFVDAPSRNDARDRDDNQEGNAIGSTQPDQEDEDDDASIYSQEQDPAPAPNLHTDAALLHKRLLKLRERHEELVDDNGEVHAHALVLLAGMMRKGTIQDTRDDQGKVEFLKEQALKVCSSANELLFDPRLTDEELIEELEQMRHECAGIGRQGRETVIRLQIIEEQAEGLRRHMLAFLTRGVDHELQKAVFTKYYGIIRVGDRRKILENDDLWLELQAVHGSISREHLLELRLVQVANNIMEDLWEYTNKARDSKRQWKIAVQNQQQGGSTNSASSAQNVVDRLKEYCKDLRLAAGLLTLFAAELQYHRAHYKAKVVPHYPEARELARLGWEELDRVDTLFGETASSQTLAPSSVTETRSESQFASSSHTIVRQDPLGRSLRDAFLDGQQVDKRSLCTAASEHALSQVTSNAVGQSRQRRKSVVRFMSKLLCAADRG